MLIGINLCNAMIDYEKKTLLLYASCKTPVAGDYHRLRNQLYTMCRWLLRVYELKVSSSKLAPSPYRLTVLIRLPPSAKTTGFSLHRRRLSKREKERPKTHPIQNERNRYERHAQEAQRRTRPHNPQIMIHSRREQGEPRAETAPHKVVPRQHTGRILRIRVGEVIEDGLEEEESAHGEEAGANDGHNPMDTRARRPAEPKETDGYAKGANESGREAFLRFDLAVVVELRLDDLVEVIEERGHDEDGTEEDSHERETFLAQFELVDADEDDGTGFEPDVQETVDEGDV